MPAKAGAMSLPFCLVPTRKGAVVGSLRTLPAEALCSQPLGTGWFPTRSPAWFPGLSRESHAFPFTVLAPATPSTLESPEVSKVVGDSLSDVHPLEDYLCLYGCVCLCVFIAFHPQPCFFFFFFFFLNLDCGFILGQK